MKKIFKKILSVSIALCMIAGLTACGESAENETAEEKAPRITAAPAKEETKTPAAAEEPDENAQSVITVKAASDGTFTSATVKKSGDEVEEAFDAAALPFSVKITYFLNDEEVTADEIAGASGDVRIRFDYENNTSVKKTIDGKSTDTRVPLAFVSLLMLPEDRFSGVEVTNGSVTEVSENRMVYGIAVPGIEELLDTDAVKDELDDLKSAMEDEGSSSETKKDDEDDLFPQFVEIRATASDFKLDFSTTMVTNGLLKTDDGEDRFADISETISKMSKFKESGEDLTEGTADLSKGVQELIDGINEVGIFLLIHENITISPVTLDCAIRELMVVSKPLVF